MLDVIRIRVVVEPIELARGIVFWLGATIITVVVGVPALVLIPIDPGYSAIHLLQRLWGKWLLAWLHLLGVRVEFQGLQHLPRRRHSILVSNHQSMLDVFALSSVQPRHTRWVAKRQLGAIPIMGWAMHLAGFVFVDRRGIAESVRRSFEETERALGKRSGPMHLLFFAEGTRTRDGRLGAFKRGAFRMAVNRKFPIVPIVIDGAFPLLPHGWVGRLRSGCIKVRVLPSLDPDQFLPWSEEVLRDETRRRIAAVLEPLGQSASIGENMAAAGGGPWRAA